MKIVTGANSHSIILSKNLQNNLTQVLPQCHEVLPNKINFITLPTSVFPDANSRWILRFINNENITIFNSLCSTSNRSQNKLPLGGLNLYHTFTTDAHVTTAIADLIKVHRRIHPWKLLVTRVNVAKLDSAFCRRSEGKQSFVQDNSVILRLTVRGYYCNRRYT